jgi:SAM-dependent methyltransferase
MAEAPVRRPHAALKPGGRRPKAEKILALLRLGELPRRPLKVLEIGAGSGVIAAHVASTPDLACEVHAVDLLDQRTVRDGFHFQLVEGTALPYPDDSFDAVISNHVLEHVGERAAQLHHLREIARILRCDGRAYLATPNRWQLVEPHYRIAFLSWLPPRVRSSYLRARRKGSFHDCTPLGRAELESLLRDAGLAFNNVGAQAVRVMARLAHRLSVQVAAMVPSWLVHRLASLLQTHIYLLGHAVESER